LDLPPVVLKRVRALRKQHEEYEAIDEEYKKARLELEKQFLARKEVLYNQRSLIVKGEVDVPAEDGAVAAEGDEKGIPSFWLTVLTAHPAIGDLVTQEDVPALEALTNITCEISENFADFTILFHFAENEFFSNSVSYHGVFIVLNRKITHIFL
jgi:nucleosome assembly protein 1-like 1